MIDKLELLLALAKERHFGRAAEACGVTQPTMSTSLKQLEEILGVMLVQRGSRFQGFTPEGERTLDWARRIVGDTRAMRQEINGLKDKLSGEIRLAAIPTVLGMVAQLTTPFRARHPDVRFRIQSCTSAEVLGLLENLEVDAGLTYIENEPIGKVRTIPLYNESYRLLTAPDAMFGDDLGAARLIPGFVSRCHPRSRSEGCCPLKRIGIAPKINKAVSCCDTETRLIRKRNHVI